MPAFLIDAINDPGKSEASFSFNPATDYAKWVNELFEALTIKNAHLAGHSKGGWIVLNSLIEIPDRIRKAVLLAPAAGINAKLKTAFLLRSLLVGINPSVKNVTSYFKYISGSGKKVNTQYIEYLSKVIKGTRTRPIKHRQFTNEELKAIRKPVFLLFGEHEVTVDYKKVIARAKELISHLETTIVPDAGHGLQGEHPELVNRYIIDFLRR